MSPNVDCILDTFGARTAASRHVASTDTDDDDDDDAAVAVKCSSNMPKNWVNAIELVIDRLIHIPPANFAKRLRRSSWMDRRVQSIREILYRTAKKPPLTIAEPRRISGYFRRV